MKQIKNNGMQSALSVFLNSVARQILAQHAHEIPDLRRATVLLPNNHVISQLAQALSASSKLPTLLLPQMITLKDWAQSIVLSTPPQPDTQRITLLYQALRERRWFVDADLWLLSRELLTLMDDLTRHHVALPESGEEFAAQLALAYRARSGQALQFEARVVHELWYAMASSNEHDSVRDYQLRLAQLARQVDMPLYVLQACDFAAPEAHFLEACRARVPLMIFDLRKMVTDAPDCALLVKALQSEANSTNLKHMARELSDQTGSSLHCDDYVTGRKLKLFAARGLEQEAQAAEEQIRRWLIEGRQSIAIVVQDRLVARRVRALLERSQVWVRDETGWTFSTLSVSTALMRWLDVVQNDFYYQDVLDLLKSPFLFADSPAYAGKQAAWLLEQMVRKHRVVAHLENYIELAGRETPELIQPLVRLRQAYQKIEGAGHKTVGRVSQTMKQWLNALHDSLGVLGVLPGWAQDAAGQQLLQLLALWSDELQDDPTCFDFAEWRCWLAQQLDSHTFRDTTLESPVSFTHLAATRWRSFDAVLLLGCDMAHLPGPANAGLWFNDAVRASLGLPLSSTIQLQTRDDLLGLLVMNHTVLATWQSSKNGEPNLLSPYFEMLRALHLLAFGDDLTSEDGRQQTEDSTLSGAAAPLFNDCRAAAKPRSSVIYPLSSGLLPQHISPSGYNSLVACPYQFYARHILRLNELDEVREEFDKRDYGAWVHELLQRFHNEHPLTLNLAREYLVAELQRISREVFDHALAHDYLAQAWLLRWQALIPSYLDWQLENEQAGWRYQAAEQPFAIEITAELSLRGRIDRIDKRVDLNINELCVLDYKTQNVTSLKGRLKEAGEDVQLACYAFACTANAAAFVSLDDDHVVAVAPLHDMAELAQQNIARLKTLFGQMRAGFPLPAHGAETVCKYCEMKGLCRRGYSQEEVHE